MPLLGILGSPPEVPGGGPGGVPAWNEPRVAGTKLTGRTAVWDFIKALNERRETSFFEWDAIDITDFDGALANTGGKAPHFGWVDDDSNFFKQWSPKNPSWDEFKFGSVPPADSQYIPVGHICTWAQIQYFITYLANEFAPHLDWHGVHRNDVVDFIEDTRQWINDTWYPVSEGFPANYISQSDLGSNNVVANPVACIWRYPNFWPPPDGYVRQRYRQIYSLDDDGEGAAEDAIARFITRMPGAFGFPDAPVTPIDERKYGGRFFRRVAGEWELAPNGTHQADIIEERGPVVRGDIISIAYVNSLMDALNDLQRPMLSWGPYAEPGVDKVSDNGQVQDFCDYAFSPAVWTDLDYDDALADFNTSSGDTLFPADLGDWDPGDWRVYQISLRYRWETECFPGDPSTYHVGDTNRIITSDFKLSFHEANPQERARKLYFFGSATDVPPTVPSLLESFEWDDNGMPTLPGANTWVAPDYTEVTSPGGFGPLFVITKIHVSDLLADEDYITDFLGGGNTPPSGPPLLDPPIGDPFGTGVFTIAYRGWNLANIGDTVIADFENASGYVYRADSVIDPPP